ncbi:aldo/keto reductase [Rhodobacter lacus]|uniref:Aldo/keto reductase n=1 Tax=Rhodobacter lacus TaxID=1641972 RepID=A0ABW5AD97_9RHOB
MPRLPDSAHDTTAIGIGCAYLRAGSPTWRSHRLVHAALDAGARHFDVAPLYGRGTAETVLGEALRGRSEAVTITTKAGLPPRRMSRHKMMVHGLAAPVRDLLRRHRPGLHGTALASVVPKEFARDFAPAAIAASLETSLRALRRDHVDVFALHEVLAEEITEELLETLQRAQAAGKVRTLALATRRAETSDILARWPGVFGLVQYSWSALDAPLTPEPGQPFRITHRAVMRAFGPLQQLFAQDQALCNRLSAACDADLGAPDQLGQALIGAAMAANAGGITLVASHTIARTKSNVALGLDPQTPRLGARFLKALAPLDRSLLPDVTDPA